MKSFLLFYVGTRFTLNILDSLRCFVQMDDLVLLPLLKFSLFYQLPFLEPIESRGGMKLTEPILICPKLEEGCNKIHLNKNVIQSFFVFLHCTWVVLSFKKNLAKYDLHMVAGWAVCKCIKNMVKSKQIHI